MPTAIYATLVILACVNGECRERSYLTDQTLLQCMFTAPGAVAQWKEEHRDHEIKRWWCEG